MAAQTNKRSRVGAIVGAVIGGLLGLVGVVVGILLCVRRWKKQKDTLHRRKAGVMVLESGDSYHERSDAGDSPIMASLGERVFHAAPRVAFEPLTSHVTGSSGTTQWPYVSFSFSR